MHLSNRYFNTNRSLISNSLGIRLCVQKRAGASWFPPRSSKKSRVVQDKTLIIDFYILWNTKKINCGVYIYFYLFFILFYLFIPRWSRTSKKTARVYRVIYSLGHGSIFDVWYTVARLKFTQKAFLSPGELKSSPGHDINPLYHPYSVYSTYIYTSLALGLRGVYNMLYTS